MKEHTPFFSILITYRNREADYLRVERCLETLEAQSFQDFELVFVDFGSEPFIHKTLQAFFQQKPKHHYHYTDTRGHFWSRAKALNIGLCYSRGHYVLVLDIDMLLTPLFLEKLHQQCFPQQALVMRVYYLPQSFTAFDNLSTQFEQYQAGAQLSDNSAAGMIVAHRQALLTTGGYDTFTRIWGAEDLEMVEKLKALGLEIRHFHHQQAPVFHQWHPTEVLGLPKGWSWMVYQHYLQKKQQYQTEGMLESRDMASPIIHKTHTRPALNIAQNVVRNPEKHFVFESPKEKSWMDFHQRFMALHTGDYLYVDQDFAPARVQQGSRLGTWVKRLNKWLQHWGISYRLVDIQTHDTEFVPVNEMRDLLFYFVLVYENQLQDYYYSQTEDRILFVVVK